jgi:hypothetical protein
MPVLHMFIPMTKVDASQRLVYGIATAEVEDRAGEICDYASTKPNYEKWSDEIAESTAGKSFGNLRAMHGPVAAGKVISITFNDDAKQIEICAKVVDDAEWIKVTEGVYTGFSQGGSYSRRWTDEAGFTRYTAIPNEISLVDLPCLPQARFELIKTDGSREWRRFNDGAEAAERLAILFEELDSLKDRAIFEADEAANEAAHELRDLLLRAAAILQVILPKRNSDRRQNDRITHEPMTMSGVSLNTAGQARLEKRFDTLAATIADVLERVKKIEDQPLPLPLAGPLRAVAKHEDIGVESGQSDTVEHLLSDPTALSVLAIKLAQRNGRAALR